MTRNMMLLFLCCLLSVFKLGGSVNNGLGISPPMGWRSWNCYHGNINQQIIGECINELLMKREIWNGSVLSLKDLGFDRVGVDDNWQICNVTSTEYGSVNYFHNATAPNGWANLNTTKFYDLTGLVNYAHSKNVKVGWYFNNCICRESNKYPANEVHDVNFLRKYDFDGIKLDGCGTSSNISNWQRLINITSDKALLTENCHNSPNYATTDWCPMNFFRSSTDINGGMTSIIGVNLNSTRKYQDYPDNFISRPGCWAYPDMLEVGNIPHQDNASVYDMDQTHFSAWVVTSSPLILGFDLTSNERIERVWDVITNTEVLQVSQTWAGHPGRQIKRANYTITYKNLKQYTDRLGNLSPLTLTLPGFEIWAKPQPNNAWAVLLMNLDGNNEHDVTVNFTDIPWTGTAQIRDIVNHKDLGTATNSYTASNLPPFGSAFLLFTESS